MEYSAEEHLVAKLSGVESPSELYEAAVLRQIHTIFHALSTINQLTQTKVTWSDITKQRLGHIIQFFMEDITIALSNEAEQAVNPDDDSTTSSDNDSEDM